MARYTKEELAQIIDKELRQALGAPDSEVAALRLRNLQFYRAEAVGELSPPAVPDRSQLVASDVPDTVEWMLPALMRVFVQSKDSVECTPRRKQFVPQAKQAAEYLRYVFWTKNPGFLVLYELIKAALVQKMGFAKVYWDDEPIDAQESYKNLLPEDVEELLAEEGVTPIAQASREVLMTPPEQPAQPGQPPQPPPQPMPVMVYDLDIKRTSIHGCRVETVPPDEMRISPRARYGQSPPFIAHVKNRTRADLEAAGYKLEGISGSEDRLTSERMERNAYQGSNAWNDPSAPELELFEFAECYIRLDQDKDGVPELLRVIMIGDTVVEEEKADGDDPFVSFCPNPEPHTYIGQCPADFAIEPQRLNTSVMRSLTDNLYLTVNQRSAVLDGQVNLNDLTNNRPGGVVRMKSLNALAPIVQPSLDQGAWQMVDWGDKWRQRRTGHTDYSQGMSSEALNPTATGVNTITEKADQRVELIARVAAESVRELFMKMLKCLCNYQQQPEIVELMGEWVTIDPREWSNGYTVTVDVGLGTGSKDRKAMALNQVFAMQQPIAGAIGPQAMIATGRNFAEAAGLGEPEQYFPDPQPPQPPPPSPQEMVKGMELQADAQKFQAETTEKDKQRAHDAQQAQADRDAKLRSDLLALAAGVMAARRQAQPGPNILNGTTLDQNAPGINAGSPDELSMIADELMGTAQQFVQRPGMNTGA